MPNVLSNKVLLKTYKIMKKKLPCILMGLILVCTSCSQPSAFGVPIENPTDILKNFTSYWKYSNTFLKLSEDFIALDTSSNVVDKGFFLQQLTSGKYLPLRLSSKETPCYKLFKLNNNVDKDIYNTIKNMGATEYKNYQMEGKPLPMFNYVDIDGKIFNHVTTKDKIVVIKCWFIRCHKCIEEMPALNKLVNLNKNKNDIVFISIALDKEDELRNFLKKTKFNFSIVANQQEYLEFFLNVNIYPTYLIINKNGLIAKVVNSYEELEFALKKETLK